MPKKLLSKLQASKLLSYVPLAVVTPQVLLLIAYYSNGWLADMYVSFAPYILVAGVIILLLSLPFAKNTYQKVLLVVALVLTASNVFPAYDWLYSTNYQHADKGIIRVASLNKLYTNKDLKTLSKEVSPKDYDIVGMSEMPQKQFEKLKSNWRYSVSSECNCDPGVASEIVIFSNYPIENAEIISAGEDKGGMLRAEFTIEEKQLVVYAAHPMSPITRADYAQRRKTLSRLLAPRLNADRNKAVIFMGDLNVSPYSQNYKQFASSINGYTNIMKGNKTYKTWCFAGLDFICAPIDHMFVTDKLQATEPKVRPIKGTDHDLLSTEIVLK